eukprot:9467454-Pyramimonas_sp.AAC.1
MNSRLHALPRGPSVEPPYAATIVGASDYAAMCASMQCNACTSQLPCNAHPGYDVKRQTQFSRWNCRTSKRKKHSNR